MRKLAIAFFALMASGLPLAADAELGVSWTPRIASLATTGLEANEPIAGFHVAGNLLIFYASWDALALPSPEVARLTSPFGPYYLPGFLNLMDAGLSFRVGAVMGFLEAGTNRLYVYRTGLLDQSLGVNLRAGAGLRLDWVGVAVTGTALFDSLQELGSALGRLRDPATRGAAWGTITANLLPSVLVTLYF